MGDVRAKQARLSKREGRGLRRSLSCRLWTSNNPVAFGAAVVARRVVRGARVRMRRLSHLCDDEERQVSRQEMDRAVRKRVDDGADDG